MKRFLVSILCLLALSKAFSKAKQQFYQLTIYKVPRAEEATMDRYLQNAYIPALHRIGIQSVGAFKYSSSDTSTTIQLFLLVPIKSLEQLTTISKKLQKDKLYNVMAREFIEAPYNKAPYLRKEVIVMKAFKDHPQLTTPALTADRQSRVYELRSYEGATEALVQKKIHMFNEGNEIEIFEKIPFNAVFYGEVIAGSKMPNLVYMISFNSLEERNERWKTFTQHPEWKALSGNPFYDHTVSHIDSYYLQPTPYSDF
jgi:hypothetical protein